MRPPQRSGESRGSAISPRPSGRRLRPHGLPIRRRARGKHQALRGRAAGCPLAGAEGGGRVGRGSTDAVDAPAVIVDAHHHFWDPTRAAYPWMTDELTKIRRPFGPSDLEPELRRCGVDCSIVVQARADLDETCELLATAAVNALLAGVIGWIGLTDPQVAQTMAELKALPGGSKLVGIRHQVHDEPDPAWLLRDDVRRGLAAVADAGLAYDLLVRARELPAALETARRFKEMRLVIDHIGKPSIRDGRATDAWRQAMAPVSELSNLSCKLPGMVTEADWTRCKRRTSLPTSI